MANDDSRDAPEETGPGIGVDDLPDLMREMFLQCVADARGAVDPAVDFDAFVEELWRQTSAAFGLVRRDWPSMRPSRGQRYWTSSGAWPRRCWRDG